MSQIHGNASDPSQNSTQEKRPKNRSDKRARSLRLFSIGSVAVVCAILLVVNLIFDSLAGDRLTWDFTDTKINSIGKISTDLVSKLDKNVEIVGLFELTQDNEKMYSEFVPILADYAAKSNGHITVRYVDPTKYPSIMTELDPNSTIKPTAGYFVLKCGDNLKVINPYECFTFDQQAYYQNGEYIRTSNNVEFNFTGAISSVTSDIQSNVYFTSNHGEASHVQIGNMLLNNGFNVADLSTLGLSVIPEDCSLLIIDGPQIDLSKDEISLITTYILSGGNLIVVSDYLQSGQDFINLNEVLHSMNLNLTNARICENDMNSRVTATNGYYSRVLPSGTLAGLADTNMNIYASDIRGINIIDNPKSYISPEALLVTSANAVLEENGDPTNVGVAGVQNAAMYSMNTGGKLPGEAVVFGSTIFTNDEYISTYSINNPNTEFFRKIVLQLVGQTNTIQAPVKKYPNFTLASKPSASVQSFWSVTLVALLPLTFIVIGIVVYKKRKNK